MKDINLNNFIIENSLDIPVDVSIGVVSVPTGLNYSDQIKKVKEQNQHANMKFTFSDPDYSGLVDKFDWANSALIFAYDYKNKINNSNLTNNIEIIDYKGFVKLVADNEKTQNWL